MSIKVEGGDFMARIPSKIEIEIEPTMKGKKLPLIQRVKYYELDSFLNRKDIVRGELFIDENTGDLYVAEKGDIETYWLRLGRTDLEKEELEQDKNPFLN